MKKVELLCPAGNKKMLEMAIHNGADAVYLAGKKFGARKFSNNFNDEEIVNAIQYAHLYGVKVYVTINTLVKDNEVDEFLKFVELIHKNGVDAVLMQDLGMIYLIRKIYPNLEVHASTQLHNHNIEGLKFLHDLGVKRAVLARELSLDEIKKLDVNIEKEIFVHGALCVCYSGECLMSSLVMNRSGNRGECAGMCRLPYKLLKNNSYIETDGEYLLSPKELCTIENIKEILDTNIDSIKIEGRMKSPEYVGFVTKIYRKAIDSYYNNEKINISESDKENLKKLYNRDFTNGYLFNANNIINSKTPNHIGIEIGKVIDTTKDKIKIKLTKNLNQGDAIRFKTSNKGMYTNFIYNKNNKLINSAKEDEIIFLDNKIDLEINKDIVLKTIDIKLLNDINNYTEKKIPINIHIIAKINEPIKIEINDGINKVIEIGSTITKAINQSLTKEIIKEKLSKLGNTIYEINNIEINLDENAFIPIKELNEIRRTLVDKLNKKRTESKTEFKKEKIIFNKSDNELTKEICILIDKEKDYLDFANYNCIKFYTDDFSIYNKFKDNKNIFYRLPRVMTEFKDLKNENLFCNDIGSINKYIKNNNLYADIYHNVTNIYTIKFLSDLGIKKIGISPELSYEEIIDLYENYSNKFKEEPNIEVFVYGKIELMILKNNIINVDKKKYDSYYLEDRNKEKFKIMTNYGKNIILNYRINNIIEDICDSKIRNFYISFIDLNNKEKTKIKEIIEGRLI